MRTNSFVVNVLALLASALLSACSSPSSSAVPVIGTGPPFYVSNTTGLSILSFNSGTTGVVNPTPNTALVGSLTLLNTPQFIARDPAGNIYAANFALTTNSITVYPSGSSGNVTPTYNITGTATQLNQPSGIAIDSKSNIWVCNYEANQILEFAPGSTGNVAPINAISGSNTQLRFPDGLYIDSANNLWVTVATTSSSPQVVGAVLEFAAGSTGNATPIRVITGSNTLLNQPAGLTMDASGNLYVANSSTPSIVWFSPGTNGNVAPAGILQGTNTGLKVPAGIAYNTSTTGGVTGLYVANTQNNTVTYYSKGTIPMTNPTPTASYNGGNTGLSTPSGITF